MSGMRSTDLAWIAGRALLGGFFLVSAFNHFLNVSVVASAAASKGVPFPTLATWGTGMLLLLGGVSILAGAFPRVGLAAILVFFIGVTFVMHDFWNVADPAMRQLQMIFFLRNIALSGAALMLMAVPVPWAYGMGEVLRQHGGESVGGAPRS